MNKFTTATIALVMGFIGGYGAHSLISAHSLINKVADSNRDTPFSESHSPVTAKPLLGKSTQILREAPTPVSQAKPMTATKPQNISQASKFNRVLDLESKQEIERVHLKGALPIPERFKDGPPPEDIAMHEELREMEQTRHLEMESTPTQEKKSNYPRPIENLDPPPLG